MKAEGGFSKEDRDKVGHFTTAVVFESEHLTLAILGCYLPKGPAYISQSDKRDTLTALLSLRLLVAIKGPLLTHILSRCYCEDWLSQQLDLTGSVDLMVLCYSVVLLLADNCFVEERMWGWYHRRHRVHRFKRGIRKKSVCLREAINYFSKNYLSRWWQGLVGMGRVRIFS